MAAKKRTAKRTAKRSAKTKFPKRKKHKQGAFTSLSMAIPKNHPSQARKRILKRRKKVKAKGQIPLAILKRRYHALGSLLVKRTS